MAGKFPAACGVLHDSFRRALWSEGEPRSVRAGVSAIPRPLGRGNLFLTLFLIVGCENKTNQPAQESQSKALISGELGLVKVDGNTAVFVIKDGKKSTIYNWNWVVSNTPNKTIEAVTQSELDSFADSGVKYK